MTEGQNFVTQPVKNNLRTYDNIRQIATGKVDDYTTDCLLDYSYFKNYYKMIARDLCKQQALDVDPKEIQQINFTANLDQPENIIMFFIIEKQKKPFQIFHKELWKYCNFFFFNIISV